MGQAHYDEAELRAILETEKDAGSRPAVWTKAPLEDGSLLSASCLFTVQCNNHGLLVRAEWNGPRDQQIFMKLSPKATPNLARLCMTKCHEGIAHWHFLEGFNGIAETHKPVINPPDVNDSAMDELLMLFVEDQNIRNFNHPGELI
jgi:hypothetical protein